MPVTRQLPGDDWVTIGEGGQQITYDWTDAYLEESGPDGTVVKATVQTDATLATYDAFQATMLGTHTGSSAAVKRSLPEPHPVKNWLYCTKCNLLRGTGYPYLTQGMLAFMDSGNANGAPGTGKLLWDVEWGDLGYRVRNNQDTGAVSFGELLRYVSRKSTAGAESLAIAGTAWKFSADDVVIKQPTTKLLKSIQLEYKWWWVPEPLGESTWRARMNTVNVAAFDTLTPGANYAVGTVLFTHYEKTDPVLDPAGNRCYHITFYFLQRPSGWNNFYIRTGASGPGFYEVVANDGSGATPFPLTSLNGLFSA